MFLTASEILRAIRDGEVCVEPFTPSFTKPVSCILRLGSRFAKWRTEAGVIDVCSPVKSSDLEFTDATAAFVLGPGEFVLGATRETVKLSTGIAGLVIGLSHLARFGIAMNMTSILVSPGFGSTEPTALTIEIANVGKMQLKLKLGMPICHLLLSRVLPTDPTGSSLARSVYEGEPAPCRPMLYEEFGSLLNP